MGTVGISPRDEGNDGHGVARLVGSVDDSVGASQGAVSIGQWRSEPLPDPEGVVERRPDNQVVGGKGF